MSGEQQAAVDRFFEAYNGDDWSAFLASLSTDMPEWTVDATTVQNTELMRYDFIWAAAMGQTVTPTRCIDQYGVVACTVMVEDDLHRALAPFGFEPSVCEMSFEFDGETVDTRRFSLFNCFHEYDSAMHLYGDWFESAYPDLDPIQGLHYRAWNQTDETAGARAAEHLDQWITEVVEPFVAGGGDIWNPHG